MAEFMIESPHTKEECMAVMDSLAGKKSGDLKKFEWGCMFGEHKGWAKVKAKSESDAKKIVPASVRSRASATQVQKVSARDLKKFHEEM